MAESLAVRYRPRRFADVAGQRHVTAVLRSAASRSVPPQQILLAGSSGLGKTTTARIFAAALLCDHRTPDGDACGLCDSCLEITGMAGGHPDVIELDAASNGGKDEIRDLAERAVLSPMRGDWKVYIVDEAHGLTGPGGQAFLRLLEEPPGHCLFILATTDPGKLPTALRGRCLNLEVLPPTAQEVRGNLERIAAGEDWTLTTDAIDAVMAASDPALGMRGTVMTLDKLAGYLESDQELTGDQLEDILGVAHPRRLAALTEAILAGDRSSALLTLAELQTRSGRTHLRRQLTAWAREELTRAATSGQGVDAAFYRFATLVEAPAYPGGFTVAVARATSPHLSYSPDAVRALLEQAEHTILTLARGAGTVLLVPVEDEDEGPADPLPPAPGAPPHPQRVEPAPEQAAPAAHSPAAEDPWDFSEPALGPGTRPLEQDTELVPVDPTSSAMVGLLNVVGKISGAAAFVLRRCEVLSGGDQLYVRIPAAVRAKAASTGLAGALDQAAAAGSAVHLID